MDQIDCYENVRTKLTVTLKCRDQNDVFAKKEKKEKVTRLQDKSSKKEHVMPCHQNVEMGFLIFCQLGLNK